MCPSKLQEVETKNQELLSEIDRLKKETEELRLRRGENTRTLKDLTVSDCESVTFCCSSPAMFARATVQQRIVFLVEMKETLQISSHSIDNDQ